MLKSKIADYVELLVTFGVEECVRELVKDSIDSGIEYVVDYGAFREKMEEYIQRHSRRAEKNQLIAILDEIGQDIHKSIKERDIDVLSNVEKMLDEEFDKWQIDNNVRWVLREDLMCQILLYTRKRDILFYNQLKEQKKNQGTFSDFDRRLIRLEQLVSAYIEHRNVPRMISGAQLHIDNADKIDMRVAETADIRRRFQEGSNVLFLQGRPGIGKTTLARLYAKSCTEEGARVFFQKYDSSIEYTVGKLAENPHKNSGQDMLNYWYGLTETERKKILLIIDNFNEDVLQGGEKEHFNRELRGDFYKRLVDSGIRILFTTRIDVGRNVYVVKPVEAAYELFVRYSGTEAEQDKSRIREVITAIKGNTLLLVLVASIWERIGKSGKQELVKRLKRCRLKEQVEVTTVYADVNTVEDMNIYEQVAELLDFSGILSDADIHKVFANAVLLPHEGMSKSMFQKLTNSKDDNNLYKLIRNSWILNEFDCIYVHPVVREIAFRNNLVTYEMCADYCKSVNEEIQIELPFEKRFVYKRYAEEIYRRFVYEETLDVILVNLFYRLSALYDGLAEAEVSMKIINRIYDDIEKVVDNPVDKARMLSGIAFSLNNCFDGMETLEQAKQLLDKAMSIIGGVDEASDKLSYVQAYGRILSNYGSNALAKSKCESDKKMLHLEEALKWHEDALAYRESVLLNFTEEETKRIISSEIATSYTTKATDYFYMEQYAKAIEHHQKAYELRDELGLENEKNINSQRIIGCILSWYGKEQVVAHKYVCFALGYYPELIQANYKVEAFKALKDNLGYFVELAEIVKRDGQLVSLIGETEMKMTAILEWMKSEERLVEMFQAEMKILEGICKNSIL